MKEDTTTEKLLQKLNELKENNVLENRFATRLSDAIRELAIREAELHAVMNSAKAILEQKSFTETARAIFDYCKDLIGATSGYVALLNEAGDENEVLFLEAGGLPCDVDPELPMPIRGLRAVAYRENRAVYHNDFMRSDWVDFMPGGHVILNNVMFAPLIIDGKTVGIIGLANKATDFDENDAKIAAGFGELAAIALQNSRNLDQRLIAEAQREKTIADLNEALSQVKKLSGLLPICLHCKKIRDDRGYWNRIEAYIQSHSDAKFSHSICRECAEKLYPDMPIYDD